MDRRRSLLAASAGESGEDSIFPMHLTLTQVGREEYRIDPTPESIALCNFLLGNMYIHEGGYEYIYIFQPNQLFINDVEIEWVSSDPANFNGSDPTLYGNAMSSGNIFNFIAEVIAFYWKDGWSYPKGTIRIFSDD